MIFFVRRRTIKTEKNRKIKICEKQMRKQQIDWKFNDIKCNTSCHNTVIRNLISAGILI